MTTTRPPTGDLSTLVDRAHGRAQGRPRPARAVESRTIAALTDVLVDAEDRAVLAEDALTEAHAELQRGDAELVQLRAECARLQAALPALRQTAEAAVERNQRLETQLADCEHVHAHLSAQFAAERERLGQCARHLADERAAAEARLNELQAQSAAAIGQAEQLASVALHDARQTVHQLELRYQQDLHRAAQAQADADANAERARLDADARVEQARSEAETAVEQARVAAETAVEQARSEAATAVVRARLDADTAVEQARLEADTAVEQAHREATTAVAAALDTEAKAELAVRTQLGLRLEAEARAGELEAEIDGLQVAAAALVAPPVIEVDAAAELRLSRELDAARRENNDLLMRLQHNERALRSRERDLERERKLADEATRWASRAERALAAAPVPRAAEAKPVAGSPIASPRRRGPRVRVRHGS